MNCISEAVENKEIESLVSVDSDRIPIISAVCFRNFHTSGLEISTFKHHTFLFFQICTQTQMCIYVCVYWKKFQMEYNICKFSVRFGSLRLCKYENLYDLFWNWICESFTGQNNLIWTNFFFFTCYFWAL